MAYNSPQLVVSAITRDFGYYDKRSEKVCCICNIDLLYGHKCYYVHLIQRSPLQKLDYVCDKKRCKIMAILQNL